MSPCSHSKAIFAFPYVPSFIPCYRWKISPRLSSSVIEKIVSLATLREAFIAKMGNNSRNVKSAHALPAPALSCSSLLYSLSLSPANDDYRSATQWHLCETLSKLYEESMWVHGVVCGRGRLGCNCAGQRLFGLEPNKSSHFSGG